MLGLDLDRRRASKWRARPFSSNLIFVMAAHLKMLRSISIVGLLVVVQRTV